MKICPYCGQENPDDATVCSIDQKRLDPDAPLESPRERTVIDMAARPFTVTLAVQLLAADTVFSLVMEVVRHQWSVHRYPNSHYSSIDFYVATAFGLGIWTLFLYSVYRGKNWARWLVSCLIVPGIIVTPFLITRHLAWTYCFNELINMTAVVALFQHPSNEWYKGSKRILSEPVPAI